MKTENDIITRNPADSELPVLQDMWQEVFGTEGSEAFFRHLYSAENAIVAEHAGKPAAMGYLIPMGELVSGSFEYPCAMLYAIATLPEYRSRGLGAAVVNRLISAAYESGYQAAALCPSGDSLFDYYGSRTPLRDWFFAAEVRIAGAAAGSTGLAGITAEEYSIIRERLLAGTAHIKQSAGSLAYQRYICDEQGGGLYRIGDSCAVVEVQAGGTVYIKEMLVSGNDSKDDIVSAVAGRFPSPEIVCRFPCIREHGRRFGMLALKDGNADALTFAGTAPWYGPAFD